MYGDSITEQNYYNQWVELYTVTRFPLMRVHFFDAGVGGDRVTGGGGGPIDLRLARDVFAEKPTVVSIMLGMNDGGYRALTPEIETTYTKGYEHILDSIHEHAPAARVTLLGPSPYDDVTAAPWFPGGYNASMVKLAEDDRQLAKTHDATFVNLNPAVVEALTKAQAMDPAVAKLLIPDRVHPDQVVHWVMAEALLKGWNAPALVSSVEVYAKGKNVGKIEKNSMVNTFDVEFENTKISDVMHDDSGIRWTQLDNGLPLPLIKSNAGTDLLLRITDIEQALNQEPLRVISLAPGQYTLSIDERVVGIFSADDLARGINLAEYDTPMRQQAQRVSWMVRDRDETHYIHLRMRVRHADTGAEDGADRMQALEDSLEDSIYAEAAPVAHHFELKPAPPPAPQSAQ
jgi:lysophospholipase L1-like esterase